jgi:hypothetical protein
MPWPWPLSAVEEWFSSWRSWIGAKLNAIGDAIYAIDWPGQSWFQSWRSWIGSKLNAIGDAVYSLDLSWITDYFNNLRNTLTTTVNQITQEIGTRFEALAGTIANLRAQFTQDLNTALYDQALLSFAWNFAVGEVNKVLKLIEEALKE